MALKYNLLWSVRAAHRNPHGISHEDWERARRSISFSLIASIIKIENQAWRPPIRIPTTRLAASPSLIPQFEDAVEELEGDEDGVAAKRASQAHAGADASLKLAAKAASHVDLAADCTLEGWFAIHIVRC